MTVTNKKSAATNVDVFPDGKVLSRDGDAGLVQTGEFHATWYTLKPAPDDAPEVPKLDRGTNILRQKDNLFQIEADKWVKVAVPTQPESLKTYFQVMKVQHVPLIMNPQLVFVQYRRDKSTEWVRNIQVAEKPKPKFKIVKSESKLQKEFANGELASA